MDSDIVKSIRLLIIDICLHKAENITSSLRATGLEVRAEFADNSESMYAILETKTFDLVLFSLDITDFTLKQVQQLISECGRHVGLVAMTNNLTAEVMVRTINEGAQDVVSSGNLNHLLQVIKREALSLSMSRKAGRMEFELMENEKRCLLLLANSKDAVAYLYEGMHIYANEVYLDLFGKTNFSDLESTPIVDMVSVGQQEEVKKFLRALSQNKNESNQLNLQLLLDSGETIETTLEFSRARFDGEPCTQILIRSVTDTSELETQINYLHQHDLVSGLYNRQYYMDALSISISKAVNGIQRYAIIYISIDNFESIRETIGISGCDVLITNIAKILQENTAKDQLLARFGSNSYAILSIITDKKSFDVLSSNIHVLVEQHISEIDDQSFGVTCSTSVCYIDEVSPDNANKMMTRAEKTCDEAQKEGGNRTKLYVPKSGEMSQEEADDVVAQSLKSAIAENRISELYEPLVSIKSEAGERYISGLALMNIDNTPMDRNDYQTVAERTGMAKTLDRWIILHIIKKIAEFNKKSRQLEFFIPLSINSILDSDLTQWVSDNLIKSNVSGEQLVFLVNETDVVNQLKATKTLFDGLKKINCQFGFDQFGTEVNSFQLFKHINADYIRISLTYMEKLAQKSADQNIIRELAIEALKVKVRVITPGVNSAALLSMLWSLSVDFVHGDFLQKPTKDLNYDFSFM
jgi:diguanylate cyclase (GGDEF)-like protein